MSLVDQYIPRYGGVYDLWKGLDALVVSIIVKLWMFYNYPMCCEGASER